MMKKISTTYVRTDTIDFIIDDDAGMNWLASFDSKDFNRFFVIIDSEVDKLWGNIIRKNLKKHKKEIFFLKINSVEYSKSLDFYPRLVGFLEKHKCNLFDLVIVIGGGIVLDLVSFTCSTYMRGLKFYAIPTTIIGQIDASTAGKTCLNTKNSKNLLGTFYYPLKVYNNINFLKTNSQYYSRQGYSEIFKYGLLGSPKLIGLMSSYFKAPSDKLLVEILKLAAEARIMIRQKHPLASNLGHTFGHAIEKISNFKILHGDAISAGIIISLYFSRKIKIIDNETINNITKTMQNLGLNVYIDKNLNVNLLVDLMMRDKKSSSNSINLVLISGIAKPYHDKGSKFYKTTPQFVKSFLKEFVKKYPYQVRNCAQFIKTDNIRYGV